MSLIDNTTWSGKEAQGFYSDTLLKGKSRAMFRKEVRVKSSININSLNITGNILQDDACTLSGEGDYTLAPKALTVCGIAFKVPFCTLDWENNYLSEQLSAGANGDQNFPSSAIDYIFMKMQETIDRRLEIDTFQGDASGSPATMCDGLQKQLLADSNVIDFAVDGTKLQAASTVIGELTRIYNAIPDQVKQTGKVKMLINIPTASAYKLALVAANPALVGYNQGNYELTFIDVPMVVCPGLGAYKAIACVPEENLVWGTDLESDEMYVSFVADPLNPKTSYAMGSFKFGVTHLNGAEIVYYN